MINLPPLLRRLLNATPVLPCLSLRDRTPLFPRLPSPARRLRAISRFDYSSHGVSITYWVLPPGGPLSIGRLCVPGVTQLRVWASQIIQGTGVAREVSSSAPPPRTAWTWGRDRKSKCRRICRARIGIGVDGRPCRLSTGTGQKVASGRRSALSPPRRLLSSRFSLSALSHFPVTNRGDPCTQSPVVSSPLRCLRQLSRWALSQPVYGIGGSYRFPKLLRAVSLSGVDSQRTSARVPRSSQGLCCFRTQVSRSVEQAEIADSTERPQAKSMPGFRSVFFQSPRNVAAFRLSSVEFYLTLRLPDFFHSVSNPDQNTGCRRQDHSPCWERLSVGMWEGYSTVPSTEGGNQ